jgi:hypothetical protein
MRTKLMACLAIFVSFIVVHGQQPRVDASVAEFLAKLHSSAWQDRREAFEDLRLDSTALSSQNVRAGLLDLLDRENQLLASTNRAKGPSVDEKYGEEYAEYVGRLGETVETFADWNDPRQVCIFVHEAYNPESRLGAKISAHAKIALPCLLEMSKSDIVSDRAEAIPVLSQALAKGKDSLDAESVRAAKEQIVKGLQDPNSVVRGETVIALGDFGDVDMIPALQAVARSDPASDSEADGDKQWFPIREAASSSIMKIKKRANGN